MGLASLAFRSPKSQVGTPILTQTHSFLNQKRLNIAENEDPPLDVRSTYFHLFSKGILHLQVPDCTEVGSVEDYPGR